MAGFRTKSEKGKWVSAWEGNAMRHSFGTYHFAIKMSFVACAASLGFSSEKVAGDVGTNIAWIIHSSQFIMMVVIGFICYLLLVPKMKLGAARVAAEQAELEQKELAQADN